MGENRILFKVFSDVFVKILNKSLVKLEKQSPTLTLI